MIVRPMSILHIAEENANAAQGLNNWLINAFNGEWLRTEDAMPMERIGATAQRR